MQSTYPNNYLLTPAPTPYAKLDAQAQSVGSSAGGDVTSMAKRCSIQDDTIVWINEVVSQLENKLAPFLQHPCTDKAGDSPVEAGNSPLEDYFIASNDKLNRIRRRLSDLLDRVVA